VDLTCGRLWCTASLRLHTRPPITAYEMAALPLRGLSYLVTGSTDGIGKHTATLLASKGATVLMHGRDRKRGEAALRDVEEASKGKGQLELYINDLSSLEGVRNLAKDVSAKHPTLHCIINNAGAYAQQRSMSPDGYELTFAVNVLAPFLLNGLLLENVKQFKDESGRSCGKIVNVASILHAQGGGHLDFGNLQQEKGFDSHAAYALSKLCLVCLTYSLAEKLGSTPTVNCCHPGTINTKMLTTGWGAFGSDLADAKDEFDLATNKSWAHTTGKYFVDSKPQRSAATTYNSAIRAQLWEHCAKLTGFNY